MRRSVLALTLFAPVALVACGPTVPESGAGVGFNDYNSYNAQREASLTTGAPMVAAGAQPIMGGGVSGGAIGAAPTPAAPPSGSGFSPERIGAAIDGAAGAPAPTRTATGAPLSALPPLGAAGTDPAMAQPMGAASALPPVPQPGPIVPASQLPSRAGDAPNLVQYALSTNNAVGQPAYDRSSLQLRNPEKACAAYGSADKAQEAFLDAGGPQKDRKGLDPDGDGFACGWDPTPFRNAVR